MNFDLATVAFYYMAGASVTSAILAVTRKNPVHSMLWVLSLFMHVAGIFLLLGAELLAAVQVIVYAGAILIFYLLIVMLLDLPAEESQPRFGAHWPLATSVGIGFILLTLFSQVKTLDSVGASVKPERLHTAEGDAVFGSLAQIGMELFGPFALPFEIASLILLTAIVGAIVLARGKSPL